MKKSTEFKKFIINKLNNKDFSLSYGEAVMLWFFSSTGSGNVSSGRMADFLEIPADRASIDIYHKFQQGTKAPKNPKEGKDYGKEAIFASLNVGNYKNIINKPQDYSLSSRIEFSREEFEKKIRPFI